MLRAGVACWGLLFGSAWATRRGCPVGKPPVFGECVSQEEVDMRVEAAQVVGGPFGEGIVDGGVEPK